MKKLFAALLCATMVFGVSGCGNDSAKKVEPKEKEYLNESDLVKAYSDPKSYIGKYVKLSGKVFSTPEKDDDGVYFQMFADPENNKLNTVVAYPDPTFEVNTDDYVVLDGKIVDKYEGENVFGGSVTAVQVVADSVKMSTYVDAVSPAIKTITPTDLKNSQNGVEIAITKIEFAKTETRVYYSVKNNSGSKYRFYDFNMKAIQNGKQFDVKNNYNADYPSVSGDVLNGVVSKGIADFQNLEQADFTLHLEAGYNDDFNMDFEEISFNVVVK
ncbi:lipoprotein [[Eubacterium] hominis]|uniref:LptM family lipoprotein n=1 Tax=[Eubacterium] hominis TaxID=2764325 RepID=UPI003A4D5DB2